MYIVNLCLVFGLAGISAVIGGFFGAIALILIFGVIVLIVS